jgi:hypothetical protein
MTQADEVVAAILPLRLSGGSTTQSFWREPPLAPVFPE